MLPKGSRLANLGNIPGGMERTIERGNHSLCYGVNCVKLSELLMRGQNQLLSNKIELAIIRLPGLNSDCQLLPVAEYA